MNASFSLFVQSELPENWTDTKETLLEGMVFNVKYLGMTLVGQPKGEDMASAAIRRIVATVSHWVFFWFKQPYNRLILTLTFCQQCLTSCTLYFDFIVSNGYRKWQATGSNQKCGSDIKDFNYSDSFYRNSLVDLWNYSLKLQYTLSEWLNGEDLSNDTIDLIHVIRMT